ncbi:unnamed protein product [Acanthoscelides obtectus]|uniref:Uncharacterized protein n=1 Tax=Acanthoscelides obtectus TaxID=200917 RepID=A0A9P0QE49_ACAOB|nr:unnamed protein product [Acanthoscelides obtectus]CAK1687837.1 hypothetical protein AOBTE_LOCUS36401 [Acanthoscelides obtectus]
MQTKKRNHIPVSLQRDRACGALYKQHPWFHVLFPVQYRDSTHDRLWRKGDDRRMPGSYIHHVCTEYYWVMIQASW